MGCYKIVVEEIDDTIICVYKIKPIIVANPRTIFLFLNIA